MLDNKLSHAKTYERKYSFKLHYILPQLILTSVSLLSLEHKEVQENYAQHYANDSGSYTSTSGL